MANLIQKGSVTADERIIDLYWQRDEEAIRATDEKYGTFLFRLAYNVLHDREDCEECKNDTYLDVWRAIPPTRPTVFQAFLTQIMRRRAIDRYKEKSSQKRIPSEMTVAIDDLSDTLCSEDSVEGAYDAKELGRILSAFVRKLPERQKYIFIDRYYFCEPVEKIAAALTVSPATVYRETDKIKQSLRALLERNGITI